MPGIILYLDSKTFKNFENYNPKFLLIKFKLIASRNKK